MSKKGLIVSGFIVGLGVLTYGLIKWYKYQIGQALNYCYKIKSYEIVKFDLNKILMNIKLLIRNRSDFDMDLYGYDIKVFINGINIAILKNNIAQKVNNNSLSLITLTVDAIPKNLFKNIQQLTELILYTATDRKKVIIKVEGTVSAGSSFIKVRDLPIDISMSLDDILKDDPNKEKCSIF